MTNYMQARLSIKELVMPRHVQTVTMHQEKYLSPAEGGAAGRK